MDINMDWDQFINNALDAIIISDKDGRIVQANVRAAENLHLSLDALIDSTADNLVEQGIYDNSVILKAMNAPGSPSSALQQTYLSPAG